jgi:colanic acid/amylovoran biosynthesis glycosyltransferase
LKDLKVSTGKFITAFHGSDMSRFLRHSANGIYDSLFVKGDLFLPISDRWKEQLIELGCRSEKIVVHRMGVDTRKFSFRPRKPKNDAQIQLLTIARLVEKKGVEYGIQAVAKVVKRFPNIEYKIVGDGPLKGQLEKLIDELRLGERVALLGWREQEEVVQLMREADILLAPSVTSENGDQEGIPVVLMEALAQGLPVVTTYHSGIPELIHDNKSGLLVRERDLDGLVEKIEYLLVHQEIWGELGKEGRRYIEKNHDVDKLSEDLVELYKTLLNGSNKAPGRAEKGL